MRVGLLRSRAADGAGARAGGYNSLEPPNFLAPVPVNSGLEFSCRLADLNYPAFDYSRVDPAQAEFSAGW